jgi:uncharacterized repeat protein (TIGR01451 family)
VDGAVRQGDVVVCTFTNTRKPTAPEPGPTPPIPPQPPLPPEPGPLPGLADLSVTKTASPTTAPVGTNIRWTVTVTNESSIAAADVNVVRLSELPHGVTVISITPSQGTCTSGGCNLGRLAPGAKATITVVTKATRVGPVLNVVRVGSEEEESNYLNNTAAALVRITPPIRESVVDAARAAAAAHACKTLVVQPHVLQAGNTSIVLTTAHNPFGDPLRNRKVHALGVGINDTATTDRRGVARFALTPAQLGIVRFRALRLPSTSRSNCRTLLAVLAAKAHKPVTG